MPGSNLAIRLTIAVSLLAPPLVLAKDIVLKCSGSWAVDPAHLVNAYYKIDPEQKAWQEWSDPSKPWSGSGRDWQLFQKVACGEFKPTRDSPQGHGMKINCKFEADKFEHRARFVAYEMERVWTITIDRASKAWTVTDEWWDMGKGKMTMTAGSPTTVGACTPAADPAAAAPPKNAF
jgi:hypothetical protein